MTGTSEGRDRTVELGEGDADQPAGRIFALVLGDLLDNFRHHEPAVLAGADPEALHDYRVALRRTRSVLRAGSRVYPPEELELLGALTSRLASATSPVRDLDVLLGSLEDDAEEVAVELGDGLEQLRAELVRRHAASHAELVELITGDTHPVLLRRWQVMASVHRVGGSDPGPDALRPARTVTDELIAHAHRRVVRHGSERLASEDPAQWHKVRKRAKRLRYLVSIFGPLYPPDAFERLLGDLSDLQDAFGDLQDHVVQARIIEDVGVHLGGRAALAAGALSDQLHHRVHRDLQRCRTRLDRLDRKKVRRELREALDRR